MFESFKRGSEVDGEKERKGRKLCSALNSYYHKAVNLSINSRFISIQNTIPNQEVRLQEARHQPSTNDVQQVHRVTQLTQSPADSTSSLLFFSFSSCLFLPFLFDREGNRDMNSHSSQNPFLPLF